MYDAIILAVSAVLFLLGHWAVETGLVHLVVTNEDRWDYPVLREMVFVGSRILAGAAVIFKTLKGD